MPPPPPGFEIEQSSKPAEEPRSVAGFVGNVVKSGAKLVSDVANMAVHPINTITAIGGIPVGLWTKAGLPVPKDWSKPEATKELDGIVQHLTSRYGSLDAAKKAMYEDPVGVAADAAAVLGGVSGAARGAAGVARGAGLARTATVLDATASGAAAVNPARVVPPVVRGAGNVAKKAGTAVVDAANTPLGRAVIGAASPRLGHAIDALKEAKDLARSRKAPVAAPPAEPPVPEAAAAEVPERAAPPPPAPVKPTAREIWDKAAARTAEAPNGPSGAEKWAKFREENVQKKLDPDYVNPRKRPPGEPPTSQSAASDEVAKQEAQAAGTMEDLRRGVQSILDRRKNSPGRKETPPVSDSTAVAEPPAPAPKPPEGTTSATRKPAMESGGQHTVEYQGEQHPVQVLNGRPFIVANGKRIPMSEVRAGKPSSAPAPAPPETPAVEPPAKSSGKQIFAEARAKYDAKTAAQPDWETKPRAAKVDAFVEHLVKHKFTPELVNAISDTQWKAVAQSAGQNAPSADTIAAIKRRFGWSPAPVESGR
jgi:hypothetical protein